MSAFRPDGWTTPELAQAVERGQLELHYQPVVDLRSGGIVGAEALLRWRHPTLGLLPPGQFLPVGSTNRLSPGSPTPAGVERDRPGLLGGHCTGQSAGLPRPG